MQEVADAMFFAASSGARLLDVVGRDPFWPAGEPDWKFPNFTYYRARPYDHDFDLHHDNERKQP